MAGHNRPATFFFSDHQSKDLKLIEKTTLNYDEIVALAIEEAIEIGDLSSDIEHYLRIQRKLGGAY